MDITEVLTNLGDVEKCGDTICLYTEDSFYRITVKADGNFEVEIKRWQDFQNVRLDYTVKKAVVRADKLIDFISSDISMLKATQKAVNWLSESIARRKRIRDLRIENVVDPEWLS